MLEIILYAYLTGWVGTSGYFMYDCTKPETVPSYSTQGECMKGAAMIGSVWPMVLVAHQASKGFH